MAVIWDKFLYDLAYSTNAEPDGHPNTRPPIMLHYHRYVLYPEMLRRAQAFVSILGLTTADKILLVGCGFGWTAEALAGLGYTVIGTDVSSYIHNNKALSEDSDISAAITAAGLNPVNGEGLGHFNRLRGDGTRTRATVANEDSGNTSSRNRVRNLLGENPTIAISEDLVTSLTDSECASLQTNIERYAGGIRICHFLTEFANASPPFNFNSKSIDDWKLMFPTATIIADGYTYKVL